MFNETQLDVHALAASSCCSKSAPVKPAATDTSAHPMHLLRATGKQMPNLEKIYQLPPAQRSAALTNLLQRIIRHFIERDDVSNERMMLAFGFDRPTLAKWLLDAKAATKAKQEQA